MLLFPQHLRIVMSDDQLDHHPRGGVKKNNMLLYILFIQHDVPWLRLQYQGPWVWVNKRLTNTQRDQHCVPKQQQPQTATFRVNKQRAAIELYTACLPACLPTYVPTYPRTHVRTYVHTYTYIHTYIHRYIHTYVHTYINTYRPTCIHTDPHAYTYTYTHMFMHTCTHRDMDRQRDISTSRLHIQLHCPLRVQKVFSMAGSQRFYVTFARCVSAAWVSSGAFVKTWQH